MDLNLKLRSNGDKLRKYIEANEIEAYRLYYLEERDWPVAIDLYPESAVIHVFEKMESEELVLIMNAVKDVAGVQNVYFKDRSKEKSLGPVIEPLQGPKMELILKENGCSFYVNLSDYLDTGLFLDHRETRKWVAGQSKDKTVLNTFAYTGSFSVYAAKAGAKKTYSVDLSKAYCEWIRRNMELNGLGEEQNWVYKMDTMEFFRYAQKKNIQFDIIIIDPPTFSRNKGKHFSVQKDHPELILSAKKLLNPGGFILFSNNYQEFSLHEEALDGLTVKELDTVPPDFRGSPISPVIHRSYIIE